MQTCPSPERWQAHLEGDLAASEQAALTEHLESCAACQKTLETIAAGDDSLLDVAKQVGARENEGGTEGGAPRKSDDDATQAEATAAADSLAFLSAPQRKGSLGRLDHYEVLEILGKGGFGTVVKAFDEKLHRVVAIKILAPELAASGPAKKRFLREARAAAAVKHDNVVGIYAVIDESTVPYLVMEYIEGQTLQGKLDKTGPLEVKEILRIGYQIAVGLASAHKQGLIHRDIKPGNILLENGVERVKITDFGLARAADDASVTQSGVVAGTPLYMSPEQAEGLTLDQTSDLFSLGTVLYVMCTGRPPFRASGTMAVLKRVCEDTPRPIREINPEIPQWLCDIVAKLHAKKPEDRYQTAKEVSDELAKFLSQIQLHGGVLASPAASAAGGVAGAEALRSPGEPAKDAVAATGASKTPRPRSRRKLLVAALLALMLVGVGTWFGPGWFLYLSNQGILEFELVGGIKEGHAVLEWGSQPAISKRFDLLTSHRLEPGKYRVTQVAVGGNRPNPGDIEYPLSISVTRGQRERIRIEWKSAMARIDPLPVADKPGWVQLFNGKDLEGWTVLTMPPHVPGTWKVENGMLIGRGGHCYLFTERGNYQNFQLRVEARINADGDSGVFFRTPLWRPAGPGDFRRGHECNIAGNANQGFTGEILNLQNPNFIGVPPPKAADLSKLTRPGEWFVMEINVRGQHYQVKINEQPASDYWDVAPTYTAGHIALQQYTTQTHVEFKKIEIKELRPSAPPHAVAPFDEKQAKEHQDAWAKHLGVEPEITNSIGMKLRLIPPGKNALGSSGPAGSADAFFVGTTEVTVGQFRRFVDDAKHKTAGEASKLGGVRVHAGKKSERSPENIWTNPEFARSENHPVALVTWHDAMAFCEWLGRKEGRTYRLPTGTEWTLAERAGSGSRFYFGETSSTMDVHGWHVGNSDMHPHAVGAKLRNPWGLLDIDGNVWEMSYDWQRAGKPVELNLAKAGPNITDRIIFMGGAYSASADDALEPANGPPNIGYSHLGFRVALVGDLKAKTPSGDLAAAKRELDKVQGKWRLIRWEEFGDQRPLTADETKRTLTIEGDRWILRDADKLYQEGTIAFADPDSDPVKVDMKGTGGVAKGETGLIIWRVKGDELHYAGAYPGKSRPTEFHTGNSNSLYCVYKRVATPGQDR